MTDILTAAQMRGIEAAAMASGTVTGLELMERAGQGVVNAVFAEWPDLRAGSFRALVLCGPGNNGGDGFVVARLLREWGWQVQVFLYGTADRMPPDARSNHDLWLTMGQVSATMPPGDADLIVDALFGLGLTRPMARDLMAELDSLAPSLAKVVAVDIASGLCADSGRALDRAPLVADMTVTFHRAKLGHHLAEGAGQGGVLRIVDIGLDDVPNGVVQLTQIAPRQLDKRHGHKFNHGHALILSGGVGHGGAARLSARAALRIGAGLVTLACPPAALIENAAQLNAVMLRAVKPDGLEGLLQDSRINALCIGPGMGVDRAAGFVPLALRAQHAPCLVLDADALTAVAADAALFSRLDDRCVLTPHAGEFARLFPDIAAQLNEPPSSGPAWSKVDATRAAAARAGCVVLFKGADTVIADPSGRCVVNSAAFDRAAPWLATAGSGDVLAGFICGLLARGFAPFEAAQTAAWLHVACARSFGPGLIAEDLPEALPQVLRDLGL